MQVINRSLLIVLLLLSTTFHALKKEESKTYRRPFMGVNVSLGFGQSYTPPILLGGVSFTSATIVNTTIVPEFYIGQKKHRVYFYIQSPLGASFFTDNTGYQSFSFGTLVGIGGFIKQATVGSDNFSVSMNGGVGAVLGIGYGLVHRIYLGTYIGINFIHHLDPSYGVQYGIYSRYYTTFTQEQVVTGGAFVGLSFDSLYN